MVRRIRMLAMLIMATAAVELATPALARADGGQACCDGTRSDCCGDRCRVTPQGFSQCCSGFWDCLIDF